MGAFEGDSWTEVRRLYLDDKPDKKCWFKGDVWWLGTSTPTPALADARRGSGFANPRPETRRQEIRRVPGAVAHPSDRSFEHCLFVLLEPFLRGFGKDVPERPSLIGNELDHLCDHIVRI